MRQLRKAAALSQQALAVKAGLSISVVTQLEQGSKMDPRLSTATAIARALGVTVDELVAGERSLLASDVKPAAEKKPAKRRD